jgi:hypothetical protein
LDAAPSTYVALSIIIVTNSYYRAVRLKSDSMGTPRRYRHNISPATYITLVMFVETHCRHRAVKLNSNGMATTRRYGIVTQPFRP